MTANSLHASIHERIDPVIEAIITKDLVEQVTAAQQATSPSLSALTPILTAALSQSGTMPSPSALASILIANLASEKQPQAGSSPLAPVMPILVAALATQQSMCTPSAVDTLLPILVAGLVAPQQHVQEARLPLAEALAPAIAAALVPAILEVLTTCASKEREASERGEQQEHPHEGENAQH